MTNTKTMRANDPDWHGDHDYMRCDVCEGCEYVEDSGEIWETVMCGCSCYEPDDE